MGSLPSVADRLEQLEEIKRRGLITDDEYEAKRRHLLGEM
jgi:hypothetical protein